jgi:cell division protein FtsL
MHSDHHGDLHHHHPNKHRIERFENMLGVAIVVAALVLLVSLIIGLMNSGSTPSWMPQ